MRSILLACPTLKKELLEAARQVDLQAPIHFLPMRLHSDPKQMREYLQNEIDNLENVDTIFLCVSGCGGSTVGLSATTASLVVPRTRDCLDLLLSDGKGTERSRPQNGIFLTESWIDFMNHSEMSLARMTEKFGRAQAVEKLQRIYHGFEHFYLIDTGVNNLEWVRAQVAPLVEAVNGSTDVLPGPCTILQKLVSGQIDGDFIVVPKGGQVSAEDFQR